MTRRDGQFYVKHGCIDHNLRTTQQNIVFHGISPGRGALKNTAFGDTMFKIRMSFMNIDDGQFIRRPFVLSPVELDR